MLKMTDQILLEKYHGGNPRPMIQMLEQVRALFEYRDGMLFWRTARGSRAKVGERAGNLNPNGYRRVKLDGRLYREHRVIWLLVHGEEPPQYLDHIDEDKANNRIENLRAIDNAHNIRRSLSGRNTYLDRRTGRWRAYPRYNGKMHHLGYFATEAEALAAVAVFESAMGVRRD